MNEYSIGFIGRKKGSIGSFQGFRIKIKAVHQSDVREKLYKKYEMVEGLGVRLANSDEEEQLDQEYRRPETNYGSLASSVCGEKLPLKIMESAAGFYIGTDKDGMPFSRESKLYFETEREAVEALEKKWWIQKEQT